MTNPIDTDPSFIPDMWAKVVLQQLLESERQHRRIWGIPEPTEYDMSLWREDCRRREAAEHAEWASIYDRLDHAGDIPAAILHLHEPVFRSERTSPHCEGCDADGYESEWPSWPCRTVETLLEVVQ